MKILGQGYSQCVKSLLFAATLCDPLTPLVSGMIELSNGVMLGSVATYICVGRTNLKGNLKRTCEVNDRTASWSGSDASCVLGEMCVCVCDYGK